jgi:hypothetical protein
MLGGSGVSGFRVGAWVEVLKPAEIGTGGVVATTGRVGLTSLFVPGGLTGSLLPPPANAIGKLQLSKVNNSMIATNPGRLRLT